MSKDGFKGARTAGSAHDRMDGHEELCAERYNNIKDQLDVLFKVMWKGISGIIALLVACLMALVGVIYTVQVDRPHQGSSVAIAVSPQQQPASAP